MGCGGVLMVMAMLPLPLRAAVVACGGDNQWPPSSYRLPGSNEVQGYSPDVLRAALADRVVVEVRLMPFARCLAAAEHGRQVQLVMAASYSAERAKHFLFTRSYLQLQPVQLTLHTPQAAAARLPWCGLNGFNYRAFGLSPAQVDAGSANYPDLLRKLQVGHCRGFVEYREVWQGLQKLGVAAVGSPQLDMRPLPASGPVRVHFMISRQMAGAERLREQLDQALLRQEANGQLVSMLARHLR
jgi:polar amino acid transport system substrate-binding protein